jgi:hypothetical protein
VRWPLDHPLRPAVAGRCKSTVHGGRLAVVAGGTEWLQVGLFVRTATRQRLDVIHNGGPDPLALRLADPAAWLIAQHLRAYLAPGGVIAPCGCRWSAPGQLLLPALLCLGGVVWTIAAVCNQLTASCPVARAGRSHGHCRLQKQQKPLRGLVTQ